MKSLEKKKDLWLWGIEKETSVFEAIDKATTIVVTHPQPMYHHKCEGCNRIIFKAFCYICEGSKPPDLRARDTAEKPITRLK